MGGKRRDGKWEEGWEKIGGGRGLGERGWEEGGGEVG